MIPARLKENIESVLGIRIKDAKTLSGGSINDAVVAKTDAEDIVLKWNETSRFSMFETEQKGLELLRAHTSDLVIPEVHAIGRNQIQSWIAMEYIPEGSATAETNRAFGEGLAALHKNTRPLYGLDYNNFIGRLPQDNTRDNDWLTFFMIRRIEPQLRQAVDRGLMPSSCIKKLALLQRTAKSHFPDEPASLLHGDLWSGNYLYNTSGRPALIDPAVYYGNREMELAFTMMFGPFPSAFYEGYEDAWPLQPGFTERRDLYNLYPVLVHVNLFGGAYVSQASAIIDSYT